MRPPTVLYVEDEDSDVLLLRLAFEIAGLDALLISAGDGQEAICYLAGEGRFADRICHPLPNLILLDLNLPRQSGFDVLEWIRRQNHFISLPVIVYTSSLNAEDCAKAQRLGANDYVVKFSDVKEIAEFVRNVTSRWLPHNASPAQEPP